MTKDRMIHSCWAHMSMCVGDYGDDQSEYTEKAVEVQYQSREEIRGTYGEAHRI